ncbi:hypothetical protein P7K49_040213 [Saguinus oedipus]|uniref:Uncharacterized protein n=1 Tax=Saguinus oedipus TaxID=9490 RepID=A0ABQ9T9L6_SAGOE|nr:hypothetical protein P7K49_040213 [Saguinus oedipus]
MRCGLGFMSLELVTQEEWRSHSIPPLFQGARAGVSTWWQETALPWDAAGSPSVPILFSMAMPGWGLLSGHDPILPPVLPSLHSCVRSWGERALATAEDWSCGASDTDVQSEVRGAVVPAEPTCHPHMRPSSGISHRSPGDLPPASTFQMMGGCWSQAHTFPEGASHLSVEVKVRRVDSSPVASSPFSGAEAGSALRNAPAFQTTGPQALPRAH